MQIRHKEFNLEYNSAKIAISSIFDSGNLEEAVISNNKIVLTPALDPLNLAYSTKHSSKTFFHFKVTVSESVNLQVVIRRMNILQYFSNDQNFEELYRICIGRCLKGSWSELLIYQKTKLQAMKRVFIDGNYELHFNIDVNSQQEVYLAYHYPYSYQKLVNYLQEIKERVNLLNSQEQANLYYCNELLTQSLERRSINLLTLTHTSQIQEEEEARVSKSIFPYYEMEGRPKKFNKPYIFFTCRVHSGQTSSSYALQGMINFLLSADKKAKVLLKSFVFLIVPVLNPDGVFHGTYRMDTMGHNLNRFYNCAQSHKQPSIFAVQSIVNYYSNRIIFFMDLHSHPHPNKGSFIYGNCLQQIQDQTESQLFAKLLQAQSRCFGYHWCSFSNTQMNSRDINEILTKDGSARVQVYKLLNIPFIYTMQMGYHGCQIKNESETQSNQSHKQKKEIIFTTQDYRMHGKSIIVTIFNIFSANVPLSVRQQTQKPLQQERQQISKELIDKQERFRLMDSFVYRKIKNMSELIYSQYYQPLLKKYPFVQHAFSLQMAAIERGLGGHSTSQNNTFKSRKNSSRRKQTSLTLPFKSRTIDVNDSKEKVSAIKSFKSTLQPRQNRAHNQFLSEGFNLQQGNKFAKQVNLNFNPFPLTERKKIYNVIGNSRSVVKKSLTSQFSSNQKEVPQNGMREELEIVEQLFKSIEKDQFRDKKLKNFNPKSQYDNSEQPKQTEYLDNFWSVNHQQHDRFILPKIPVKSDRLERFEKLFDMEVQIQKQYDHKYRLHQHKNLSPMPPPHIKSTLRSNGLKMKNMIKPLT